MWQKKVSRCYLGISREAIWNVWADVKSWPKWDKTLKKCEGQNPFIQGAIFRLTPTQGPSVDIILSEVTPYHSFTDFCKLKGAVMYVVHQLSDTQEGLKITVTITIKGWLSWLWVNLFAKKLANNLDTQLDTLVDYASAVMHE